MPSAFSKTDPRTQSSSYPFFNVRERNCFTISRTAKSIIDEELFRSN